MVNSGLTIADRQKTESCSRGIGFNLVIRS